MYTRQMRSDRDRERLIDTVRRARARLEEQQDRVQEARDAYVESVQRLYVSGMPLRDIADELGLSHQRVHQMVTDGDSAGAAKRKVMKGAAGVALLALLFVVGGQLRPVSGDVSQAATAVRAFEVSNGETYPDPVTAVRASLGEYGLGGASVREVFRFSHVADARVEINDGVACYYIAATGSDGFDIGSGWIVSGVPTPCDAIEV